VNLAAAAFEFTNQQQKHYFRLLVILRSHYENSKSLNILEIMSGYVQRLKILFELFALFAFTQSLPKYQLVVFTDGVFN